MSIERIKQEAAKADQIIADLAKQRQAAPADEVGAEQVPGDPEAAQPEVDDQLDQGVVANAATEDQTDPDLARIQEESAKWEQRYRSLNGMIEARDRQIEQLHQLISGMQQAPAKPDADAASTAGTPLVGKADEEAFGADLIDLARRVFKEEFSREVTTIRNELTTMKESLQGVAQTTALSEQDRFEGRLTQKVPNWRELDADQRFIEWLQSTPTRAKIFAEAARGHDVDGVAYFFTEFARLAAPVPKTSDDRLAKQLAPGKSKATAAPASTPQDKKVWTRSEIADLFSKGRRHYGAEEFARLERDAFEAQRDGRVDFSR